MEAFILIISRKGWRVSIPSSNMKYSSLIVTTPTTTEKVGMWEMESSVLSLETIIWAMCWTDLSLKTPLTIEFQKLQESLEGMF